MIQLSRVLLIALLAGAAVAAGCEEELETGYKPRRLNATSTERRAYYAPAFTPEATSTGDQKPAEGFHRPGSY
jgi:hypothetical protein